MSIVFGYYSAPTRSAGQGKWNFFRGVGVCFGLPLPDFLGFLPVVVVVVLLLLHTLPRCRCTFAVSPLPSPRLPVAPLPRLTFGIELSLYNKLSNYIVCNSYFAYILSKDLLYFVL